MARNSILVSGCDLGEFVGIHDGSKWDEETILGLKIACSQRLGVESLEWLPENVDRKRLYTERGKVTRSLTLSVNVSDRIIVPLDVSSEREAIALLDRLPQVTFWKVGLELFVSVGPGILKELKSRQKKIFLDLKLHDIPNTVAGACRAAGRYGVDLLTLHATAGKDALKAGQIAAQEGAIEVGHPAPKLLAITVLTSLNARMLAFDLKIPWNCRNMRFTWRF